MLSDLSGCSLSSLYGPLHVATPFGGRLCACKVQLAHRLSQHSEEQKREKQERLQRLNWFTGFKHVLFLMYAPALYWPLSFSMHSLHLRILSHLNKCNMGLYNIKWISFGLIFPPPLCLTLKNQRKDFCFNSISCRATRYVKQLLCIKKHNVRFPTPAYFSLWVRTHLHIWWGHLDMKYGSHDG